MKRFFFVIFLFILAVIFPEYTWAEVIRSFDENITVNVNGTIDVIETIDYDFGDLYKHGIFRTIPFIKTNQDNKKFKLDFTKISVSDQFSKSFDNSSMTLKIGDPDKTITGLHPYSISYTVSGAITYYSDHDELYWNVTGNEWPVVINQANAQIHLPVGILNQNIRAECFTGPIKSVMAECTILTRDSLIQVSAKNTFAIGNGLTIVVSFPKGIVAVLEPKPYIPFWETVLGSFLKTFLIGFGCLAAILWYIIYPLLLPYKWWKYGRDPRPGMGETSAWFDAPKTMKLRVLTPAETGALIDERVDIDDITATIVDLARRGYFKIIENQKGHYTLNKEMKFKSNNSLESFESILLTKIFEKSDIVDVKDLKLATTVESIRHNIYEQLVSEGFFPKDPQKIRSFYEVIRVLSLMTLNFPLFVCSLIFGTHMPRKTIFGSQQAAIARSLRKFLVSQEKKLTFQAKNQLMFEKLLPYAIAFNVERIWAKRFEEIKMKPVDWYVRSSTGHLNSSVFVHILNTSLSDVRSATTPISSSSGFSSGFSSGSSGGGGGGGGGGSW